MGRSLQVPVGWKGGDTSLLIPGDLCDLHIALLSEMDHSIKALSPCKVAFISRRALSNILDKSDRLGRAFWWATLVDEAILREWLVTMGHRPANQRVGHLICEMLLRMRSVGLTGDHSFDLLVTQEELGNTLGLSTVHINRTMQDLRKRGLITTQGKRMIVNDMDGLMEFTDFNPNYLHQVSKRARLAQVEAN